MTAPSACFLMGGSHAALTSNTYETCQMIGIMMVHNLTEDQDAEEQDARERKLNKYLFGPRATGQKLGQSLMNNPPMTDEEIEAQIGYISRFCGVKPYNN